MTRDQMIAEAVRSAKPLPDGHWTPTGDFIPTDWQDFNRFLNQARETFLALQRDPHGSSHP